MRRPRSLAVLWVASTATLAVSCQTEKWSASRSDATSASAGDVEALSPAPGAEKRPRVVFLGDSLTAGLGLTPVQAYPALLQRRIDEQHLRYDVVNAGVSGDTSAGGLRRLDWALEGDVRVLVVALGGNDGLRALPPEELGSNLSTIIERAQARGVTVILAGMEAPPNLGRSYVASFHSVYREVAARYRVTLVPFLLQGVAGVAALNQPDGIHPTAAGARLVADNIWPVLEPLLKRDSGPQRGVAAKQER